MRNYKKEYKNHQSTTQDKKDRAARNKARREAIREGKVSKGDGKDIDHKVPLRKNGSKSTSNTRVRSRSSNRSSNGHSKGEKQNPKDKS